MFTKGKSMFLTVLIYAFLMQHNSLAELVYDDEESVSQAVAAESNDSEVETVASDDVSSSSANANASAPSQVIVNQTTTSQLSQKSENEIRPKPTMVGEPNSEALRKERMREELKNEDRLQTRLEEMRIKDETKRVDEIFQGKNKKGDHDKSDVAVEIVQVHPHYQQDEIHMKQSSSTPISSVTSDEEESSPTDTVFYVRPNGGISDFTGNKWYEISPRFSLGTNLGFIISEYFGIDMGYTYSQYDIKMQSNLGFQPAFDNYLSTQTGPYGQYQPTYTKLVMKQNVIESSFKGYLTPKTYKFRPYLGAGLGWSKSYINYDEDTIKWIRQLYGESAKDYELSQYLGVLSAGFDVQINEDISVGLAGKYYHVLSSNEEAPLYNYGFYDPGCGANACTPPGSLGTFDNSEKAIVSGSLKDNNFYNINMGVTFSF